MIYYAQTNLDKTINNISKKFKQGFVSINVPNVWLETFVNNFNNFWIDSNGVLHKPGSIQPKVEITTTELKKYLDQANNDINDIKSSTAENSSAFYNALDSKADKGAINSVRDTLIAVNSSLAALPNTAAKQDLNDLKTKVEENFTPLANSLIKLNSTVDNKVDVSSLDGYVTKDNYSTANSSLTNNISNGLSSLDNKKVDSSKVGSLETDFNNKLNTKTNQEDLGKLSSAVDSKANKSELENGLNSKATVSYVDNKSYILSSTVSSLGNRVYNNDISGAINNLSNQTTSKLNNKADVSSLNKVSNAIDTLENTKADKDDLTGKADSATVSSANAILINSIKELNNSKANSDTVENIRGNLQNQINTFNDEGSGVVKNVGAIQEQVNGKANKADLEAVSSSVIDKVNKSDLDLKLNQKVDKNGINSLNASFSNKINSKANIKDVNNLSTIMESYSNKVISLDSFTDKLDYAARQDRSSNTSLTSSLSKIVNNKVDNNNLNSVSDSLSTIINTKVDKSYFDFQINQKADNLKVDSIKSSIENNVNSKADQDNLKSINGKIVSNSDRIVNQENTEKNDIKSLSTSFDSKVASVSQQDNLNITSLRNNVSNAIDTKADTKELSNTSSVLSNAINDKTDKSEFSNVSVSFSNTFDKKLNKNDFNTFSSSINNTINKNSSYAESSTNTISEKVNSNTRSINDVSNYAKGVSDLSKSNFNKLDKLLNSKNESSSFYRGIYSGNVLDLQNYPSGKYWLTGVNINSPAGNNVWGEAFVEQLNEYDTMLICYIKDNVYFNVTMSGSWKGWIRIVNENDINDLKKQLDNKASNDDLKSLANKFDSIKNSLPKQSDNYKVGSINKYTDILNLEGPGAYTSEWGNQDTLKNFPGGNGAAIIYVDAIGSTNSRGKRVTVINSWGGEFVNTWHVDTWTGWKENVYKNSIDNLTGFINSNAYRIAVQEEKEKTDVGSLQADIHSLASKPSTANPSTSNIDLSSYTTKEEADKIAQQKVEQVYNNLNGKLDNLLDIAKPAIDMYTNSVATSNSIAKSTADSIAAVNANAIKASYPYSGKPFFMIGNEKQTSNRGYTSDMTTYGRVDVPGLDTTKSQNITIAFQAAAHTFPGMGMFENGGSIEKTITFSTNDLISDKKVEWSSTSKNTEVTAFDNHTLLFKAFDGNYCTRISFSGSMSYYAVIKSITVKDN